MKKFIIRTFIIMLPIFVIGTIMEVMLRGIQNDYQYKKEYLDKNSNEIETLILGSSHSFYGVDPIYFSSNTFNASHISQSLNYDFEIFKKYKNNLRKLKTIVLEISYSSYFKNLETSVEDWRIKNYVIYYGINTPHLLSDYSELLGNNAKVNLKRLESYYLKNETNITCSKLGWGTTYKSENANDLTKSGKSAAIRHTVDDINSMESKIIFEENVLLINEISKWCMDRNVTLVLFIPPAFETYRQYLSTEQLNITIEAIQKVKLNNDNIIVMNLLNDIRFVENDFYDADHLSEIGSKKLSTLINAEMDRWKLRVQ